MSYITFGFENGTAFTIYIVSKSFLSIQEIILLQLFVKKMLASFSII